MNNPIDQAADKAEHDDANARIDAMNERMREIIYFALYNLGHRVDTARRAIERLAPRKKD